MKIVINMPEVLYRIIQMRDNPSEINKKDYMLLREAIKNGTPLPKGHGALIDRDVLQRYIEQDKREAFTKHQVWLLASVHSESNVPVIIEADKEIEND